MKALGACLILLAGFLTGRELLLPERRHISLLAEGTFLFLLMESGIRHQREPMPRLLKNLSDRSESLWHDCFFSLADHLTRGTEKDFTLLFTDLIREYPGQILDEKEQRLFIQLGQGMVSTDALFSRDSIRRISGQLDEIVAKRRETLAGRQRVVYLCSMSVSILAIILLI